MANIEKLDTDHYVNFNANEVKIKLRELSLKINEIIDVVNILTTEYDEDDYEIDPEDVMIKSK